MLLMGLRKVRAQTSGLKDTRRSSVQCSIKNPIPQRQQRNKRMANLKSESEREAFRQSLRTGHRETRALSHQIKPQAS
jgi:hypothetical protein